LFASFIVIISLIYGFAVAKISAHGALLNASVAKQNMQVLDDAVLSVSVNSSNNLSITNYHNGAYNISFIVNTSSSGVQAQFTHTIHATCLFKQTQHVMKHNFRVA